jgi:DNA-binding CsgD family transcriptional regulator
LRALAGVVFDRAEALSGRALPPSIPLPPPELTKREQECLRHLIAGRSTSKVAKAMAVSAATVRFHAANLRTKTGAANRAELTALAVSLGLAPQLGPDGAVATEADPNVPSNLLQPNRRSRPASGSRGAPSVMATIASGRWEGSDDAGFFRGRSSPNNKATSGGEPSPPRSPQSPEDNRRA